jgi:hypothetical protein
MMLKNIFIKSFAKVCVIIHVEGLKTAALRDSLSPHSLDSEIIVV